MAIATSNSVKVKACSDCLGTIGVRFDCFKRFDLLINIFILPTTRKHKADSFKNPSRNHHLWIHLVRNTLHETNLGRAGSPLPAVHLRNGCGAHGVTRPTNVLNVMINCSQGGSGNWHLLLLTWPENRLRVLIGGKHAEAWTPSAKTLVSGYVAALIGHQSPPMLTPAATFTTVFRND
jgi:hypothetical protein